MSEFSLNNNKEIKQNGCRFLINCCETDINKLKPNVLSQPKGNE